MEYCARPGKKVKRNTCAQQKANMRLTTKGRMRTRKRRKRGGVAQGAAGRAQLQIDENEKKQKHRDTLRESTREENILRDKEKK